MPGCWITFRSCSNGWRAWWRTSTAASARSLEELPEIHAMQRLDVGFDLEQVTREYALLRTCILRLYGRHAGREGRDVETLLRGGGALQPDVRRGRVRRRLALLPGARADPGGARSHLRGGARHGGPGHLPRPAAARGAGDHRVGGLRHADAARGGRAPGARLGGVGGGGGRGLPRAGGRGLLREDRRRAAPAGAALGGDGSAGEERGRSGPGGRGPSMGCRSSPRTSSSAWP